MGSQVGAATKAARNYLSITWDPIIYANPHTR